MFNNAAIDVSLGLIFIILAYSLLSTIIQELVARWTKLWQQFLKKAIYRMLQDGNEVKLKVEIKDELFIKAFYDYPLIKYLAESETDKPSNLSSGNFSETIIHLLACESNSHASNKMSIVHDNLQNNSFNRFKIEVKTKNYLKKLHADSDHDVNKFLQKLKKWFEYTMQRTTDWYKRRTQVMLFWTGLLVPVLFNVDLIAITKILSHDDKARGEIVSMAMARQAVYSRYADLLTKAANLVQKDDSDWKRAGSDNANQATVYTLADDSMVSRAYQMVSKSNFLFVAEYGFNIV